MRMQRGWRRAVRAARPGLGCARSLTRLPRRPQVETWTCQQCKALGGGVTLVATWLSRPSAPTAADAFLVTCELADLEALRLAPARLTRVPTRD